MEIEVSGSIPACREKKLCLNTLSLVSVAGMPQISVRSFGLGR